VSQLSDRVAIVTGSARNIGRATALMLAGEGASVVVHAKGDEEGVVETKAMIEERGGRAVHRLADLTVQSEAEGLAEAAMSAFGGIDILINNAALRRNTPFTEITLEQWHEVLANNLDCAFLATRASIEPMIARGMGCVVNVGGLSAHRGVDDRAHLAAAKMGLVGFTKALATEYGPLGITVNCVVPGLVDTIRGAAAGDKPAFHAATNNLVGREGRPEEIAHIITMLCLPNAAYTTGQIIHVNGGAYLA